MPLLPLLAAAPAAVPAASSPAQAVFFWIFAAVAVGGALATITRRNAVAAALSLVATFIAVAALFAMLQAHLLAVLQVLVYAGAILVLFVFVVMILNKEEDEPWALRGLVVKGLGGVALVYFLVRLGTVVVAGAGRVKEPETFAPGFGGGAAMGGTLMGPYLFPFEAISLVLLIAVIGGLLLSRAPEDGGGDSERRAP